MPAKKVKQPLAVTHPELAKEASGWDPDKFTAGSNKILSWICTLGHAYSCAVSKRTYRGDGCPFCSNRRLLIGFNDLTTKYPVLASQAFGWDPTQAKFNETKPKRDWLCAENHIWQASCNSRIRGGGCHICQGDKVVPGINDLLTTHPGLSLEIHDWDGTAYSSGSDAKLSWKCTKGHIWNATITSRVRGSGCSICRKKQVEVGVNDLQTLFPQFASEAYLWDPSTVFPFSNKPKEWKCPIGHVYTSTPGHRTIRQNGCPFCSNHKVLPGFNDLLTTNPQLAEEAYDWDPRTVTSGSNRKRTWRCKQGHVWIAVVSSRHISGCPTCAKYGFDPNLDGYLYFLFHPNWLMLQIGISNYIEYRLSRHRSTGWLLIEVRGPMEGHLTQQWETAILRMLKAKGADLSNDKIAGKFDGYSEAWSKSTFEVSSIKELMRLTEEFEESNVKK